MNDAEIVGAFKQMLQRQFQFSSIGMSGIYENYGLTNLIGEALKSGLPKHVLYEVFKESILKYVGIQDLPNIFKEAAFRTIKLMLKLDRRMITIQEDFSAFLNICDRKVLARLAENKEINENFLPFFIFKDRIFLRNLSNLFFERQKLILIAEKLPDLKWTLSENKSYLILLPKDGQLCTFGDRPFQFRKLKLLNIPNFDFNYRLPSAYELLYLHLLYADVGFAAPWYRDLPIMTNSVEDDRRIYIRYDDRDSLFYRIEIEAYNKHPQERGILKIPLMIINEF